MDDKTMLEGILWDLKVLGDLCLHGSIESGTLDVHSCFVKSLNEVLNLQYDLFFNCNSFKKIKFLWLLL